jgi:predicted lipid-binding transport protein (Tim44 family)
VDAVRRPSLILLIAMVAIAACGGDDQEGAEQTVRDFVTATNERDGRRFCEDLVTEEFLERTTGASGERATAACRRQLESIQELELELVEIRNTEIDGDTARVTVALETQGRPQVQSLRLKKEDGDWRLSGGGEAE